VHGVVSLCKDKPGSIRIGGRKSIGLSMMSLRNPDRRGIYRGKRKKGRHNIQCKVLYVKGANMCPRDGRRKDEAHEIARKTKPVGAM